MFGRAVGRPRGRPQPRDHVLDLRPEVPVRRPLHPVRVPLRAPVRALGRRAIERFFIDLELIDARRDADGADAPSVQRSPRHHALEPRLVARQKDRRLHLPAEVPQPHVDLVAGHALLCHDNVAHHAQAPRVHVPLRRRPPHRTVGEHALGVLKKWMQRRRPERGQLGARGRPLAAAHGARHAQPHPPPRCQHRVHKNVRREVFPVVHLAVDVPPAGRPV